MKTYRTDYSTKEIRFVEMPVSEYEEDLRKREKGVK